MKSSFHPVKYLLAALLSLSSGQFLSAQTAGTPVVQNDFTASGTINILNLNSTGTATPGSAVVSGTMNNAGDTTIQVTGTYVGTLTVQVSQDGVSWFQDQGIISITSGVVSATIPANSTGVYQVGVEGCRYMQVEASAWTSGSASVIFRVASTDSSVALDTGLPAGTNLIGAVNLSQLNGTTVVTAGLAGLIAVGGNVAVGSAPTANPVLQGVKTLSTLPSAAIANGLTEVMTMTGDQQVIVHMNGDPSNEWSATSGTTALATATSTAAKAAGAAGVRNYVTDIHVVNTSATVGTTFSILDGASVIWTTYLPASTAALVQTPVTQKFETPLKGTAATALNVQCGTTGAAVYYNVSGYQNN